MGKLSKETVQRLFLLYLIERFQVAVYGKTRLQKVAYYAAKDSDVKPVQFKSYNYGEYSPEVADLVEHLIALGHIAVLPLDTGEHGNQYLAPDKSNMEEHAEILAQVSSRLKESIEEAVKKYGRMTDARLLAEAKADPEYAAKEFDEVLFEDNLPDFVELDLPQEDCDDLELTMNPRFVSAMVALVEGVEKGSIPLEQWESIG